MESDSQVASTASELSPTLVNAELASTPSACESFSSGPITRTERRHMVQSASDGHSSPPITGRLGICVPLLSPIHRPGLWWRRRALWFTLRSLRREDQISASRGSEADFGGVVSYSTGCQS